MTELDPGDERPIAAGMVRGYEQTTEAMPSGRAEWLQPSG